MMVLSSALCTHPLGGFDEAIDFCDQALDLAEVDEEIIEALLIKFDALIAKGDEDEAKRTIKRMPAGPYENPHHAFLVGRALFEIGETERASKLIDEATQKDSNNPEAFYYLGLLRDERGDSRGATEAFLRSRDLEAEAGLPPWVPEKPKFYEMAKKAVLSLNQVLRRYVERAEIYVADVPGVEIVADGVDPRALVLIDGGPVDMGGIVEERPTRVFVYAINVSRMATSNDEIEQEIGSALEREITSTFLEAAQAERSERDLN